mgnify:CR=1 FL=1
MVGLDCQLLFPGDPPAAPSVNVELARAAGARLLFGVVATEAGWGLAETMSMSFLVIAGASGSLLAFFNELNDWFQLGFMHVEADGRVGVEAQLARRVQRAGVRRRLDDHLIEGAVDVVQRRRRRRVVDCRRERLDADILKPFGNFHNVF